MPASSRFTVAPSLILFGGIGALATVSALVLAVLQFSVAAVLVLLISTQILLVGTIYTGTTSYRRQEKRARTWGVRHSTALQQIAWAISTQRLELQAERDQSIDPALMTRLEAIDAAAIQIHTALADLTVEHRTEATARAAAERREAFREVFKDRI